MGALGKVRAALGGSPAVSGRPHWPPSQKVQDKKKKQEAREAAESAERRRRHKARVVRDGDAAGIPFDFEQKPRWFR